MPYSKTQWAAGDPITQDRLNKMEQGIADAYDKSETATNTVQNLNGTVSGHTTSINNLTSTLSTTTGIANTAYSMGEQGATAYSQIQGAIAESTDLHSAFPNLVSLINNIYSTIKTNKSAIENTVSQQAVNITTISNEVTAARGQTKYTSIGNAPNLKAKIDDMEHQIDSNITAIGVINGALEDARGDYNSVQLRFEQDESDIDALQAEVNGAHTGSATTLNERFTANETAIGERILISSIRDSLTSNDDKAVLSAAQGKVLKDMIGSGFDSLNTVAASITKVANDAQSYVDNNKVDKTDIVKNLTHADDDDTVLQARQGKLLQDAINAINNTIGGSYNESNTVNNAIATAKAEAISAAAEDATTKANAAKGYADSLIYNGLDQTTAGKALDATQGKILNDAITDPDSGLAAIKDIADEATESIEGINDIIGQGFDSTNTIASMVSTINQTLNNKADTSTVNNISNTIVKAKADVAYTGTTPSATQTWTINDKDDYLLQAADDKYYYWKHINNEWHLMGGAGNSEGGGGTSSAAFAASLEAITEPDPNTDYFVGNSNDGYLHYRFIEIEEVLTPVLIGNDIDTANIKRYNMEKVYNDTEKKYYLKLYEFNYGADNAITEDLNAPVWVASTSYAVDDRVLYIDGYVYTCITANNDSEWDSSKWNKISDIRTVNTIELPEGGGGGGSVAITRLVRITPSSLVTIQNENKIYLRFFYSSIDSTGESSEADYTLRYNNNSIIDSGSLNSGSNEQQVSVGVWPETPTPGFYQLDVTEYCRLGSQTFTLSVTPRGATSPILRTWTIEIKELRLESNAPISQLIETSESIQFPYTPFGAMTKTLHVSVDGNEIGTQNIGAAVSGSPQEYTIPAQTHGAHTISIYLTTELNGESLTTTPITRDYIWYDTENQSTPIIIASPYRGVPITAEQYEEIEIPYTIYNSTSATSTVQYYDGNTLLDTVTVTDNGVFSYTSETFGSKTLKIKVDNVEMTFAVTITELPVDVAQVPGAVINFDPATSSNTSANRLPTWTYNNQTYTMSVSDNFNWSTDANGGGYKEDVDGKCFIIKAGTYAEFDYKMFKQAVDNTNPSNPIFTNSVFDKGAEMKIIFKVAAVRDASAVWFTNVGHPSSSNSMPIGIQLSAHQGWLKTSAADAAERQAQLEGTTASTNSYLYFPYSEEDKIELDISINKQGNNENFIMSYEDGVPSKAYAYETSEILYHEPDNESIIRIGSPDCDVYIYKFRIYDKGLSTSDILRNFIADGKTITEKVNRYNRNSIYYNSDTNVFSPYKSGGGVLDPEQLAKKMPDVKILMLEAPTFTKDKNTFVRSRLRCIHEAGGTKYVSRGDEDNWLYIDGYHSGQGTTSDNYGQSSRNVDFLFMSDGVHAPTKKKNIGTDYEGYQSKLYRGNENIIFNPSPASGEYSLRPTGSATPETCLDWKGDEAKVSLTDTSVPNNYFNLKVNVASSENVNNALFQKRYNDFLRYVYQSPAYKRDNKIKNDMEFVPAILFIRETDETKDSNGNYTKHLEFNDTNWHFYSLGNIGDSKKTDYTRAYNPDDMNEFTVEISDNNTSNSQFQSGVYMSNNQRIIEDSDSGINSMNYIWDIDMETEWNALRDPTEREIEHDAQIAAKQTKYLDGTDLENAKTTYILPNGKVYRNYRHRMLSGDPFDGKHSFEFRYACKGDYRDGDLINDTNGKIEINGSQVSRDEHQFDINRQVVEAFYTWVVTSSDEEFRQYLSEWCVPEAVEYFYAFTHFYTMMDNRAKNCFWHFGKTGTHRQVHTPYKELLHVYDELINGEYVRTSDTAIDPNKTYYTEYAFDLWAYDMDTAAGIDNNGELIFPYGKEDTDYRIANVSTSGYVFNGAGSIIWRRLSTSFTDEIANIFNQVNEAYCFDATNLINEFDNFQDCYPEEMWRLDIERKYIRTFTGKVYDNSKLKDADNNTKQNIRFLKEMMQGRKKYQRRQWVRDQAIYFGSKYMLNNVRNNTIEMVCYTPDAPLWNQQGYEYEKEKYRPFAAGDFVFYGEENNRKLYKCIEANSDTVWNASKWQEGVTPDYKLKIVPYQDMYINVAVGNGNLRAPQRAVAGQEYTVDCTANMNETRVYIYAGSYIQSLSNLAPFYIGANIFSSAARLKKLDLGTDNPTYHNTNLNSLTILPNMPILEELNIKNCDSLNTPIDLSGSNNLKVVEATGSTIPSLSLPMYTSIETLHLPSTVNILSLNSAHNLTDFAMINKATGLEDYSSLLNMSITDSDYSSNIDWMSIAATALPHLSSLYLQNLSTASIQNITELEQFVARKQQLETQYDEQGNLINKLNLTGTLNVIGVWSQVEKDNYAGTSSSTWPDLTLNTLEQNKEERWQVVYKYPDEIVEGTVIPGDIIYSTYVNNDATIEEIYPSIISTMPSKASTVSTNYTFGSYRVNGSYIPLSGWKISTDTQPLANYDNIPTVRSNLIIHPYFRESERTYQVKWFLNEDNTQEIPTSYNAVAYGGGFDLIAPTVADIHNAGYETATVNINTNVNPVTATYRIFTGWNKLPTNISPSANDTSYNIYATWDSGTESLAQIFETIGSDGLTPKQLLVLSGINNKLSNTIVNTKGITAGMKTSLYLGYDGFKPGTTIIEKNNPNYYYRGVDPTESVTTTSIAPLTDNKAFTLAIDYYFDPNQTYSSTTAVAAVLAGCYENSQGSIRGFGLFQGLSNELSGIRVGFGEMFNYTQYSVQVGIPGQRNIVVLRHPANSEYLYVYSGTTAAGLLTNPVAMQSISRNIETTGATNALLNFGQLGTSSSLDSTTKTMVTDAEGTIYWAKYWDEDLGAGECEQIATWPREKMTFALSGMKDTYSIGLRSGSSSETVSPSLELLTLSSSQHAKIHYPSFQAVNTIGWGRDTDLRNLFNNILYNSLPLELKSILYKGDVYSQPAQYSSVNSESRYTILTQPDLTRDYVYNLSMANITNSDNPASYAREVANMNGLLPWLDNANVVVYNYNAQLATRWAENSSNTTRASYLTLRFPGVPAPVAGMRVFVHAEGMSETTYYQAVSKISGGIKAGDIYDISGTAYIYVTSEAIMAGIPIETGSAFQCVEGGQTVGGWVAAEPYALRSMQPGENSRTNYRYMSTGGTSAANITSTGYTANINYAFQI